MTESAIAATGVYRANDVAGKKGAACFALLCGNGVRNTGEDCSNRVLVDGHQAAPATDLGFAFSTVNAGAPASFMWQGNSMDRASEVGSGQHTVTVQESTTDSSRGTTFWLGERSLTVESAIHP